MMKTTMTVQLRRFDVLVEDQRTRETREESIVFTLEQLHAAQLSGNGRLRDLPVPDVSCRRPSYSPSTDRPAPGS